jgi:hypothetical protein
MPLYANPDARIPRNIDDYPSSFGVSLRESFNAATERFSRGIVDFFDSEFFTAPFAHEGDVYERYQAGLVSQDEANEEGGEWGLSYKGQVHRSTLDRDILREKERTAREFLIQRGPQGGWAQGSYMAASFLAEMANPLNIAFGFLPVAGPTARLFGIGAQALTRTTARRVGAAAFEGAVGNLIAEPLEWSMMSAQHRDYTMAQTLSNFMFGALAGASFRGIGEAVMIPARKAATREAQSNARALVQSNIRAAEEVIAPSGVAGKLATMTDHQKASAVQAHISTLENGMRPVGGGRLLDVAPESEPDALIGAARQLSSDLDSPDTKLFNESNGLREMTESEANVETLDISDPDAVKQDAATVESVMKDTFESPEVQRVIDEATPAMVEELGLVRTDKGVTTHELQAADEALTALGDYEKAHNDLIKCLTQGGDV